MHRVQKRPIKVWSNARSVSLIYSSDTRLSQVQVLVKRDVSDHNIDNLWDKRHQVELKASKKDQMNKFQVVTIVYLSSLLLPSPPDENYLNYNNWNSNYKNSKL